MPSKRNVELLGFLRDRLVRNRNFVLLHFSGITVNQETELRRKIRELGGEYRVIKNKLFNIALKEEGYPDFSDVLEGPNACVFSEDVITPLKELLKFQKENKGLVEAHTVCIDKEKYGKDKVEELSKLPDLPTLRAQIAGALVSPARNIAYIMREVIASLMRAIEEVAKKQNKQE